MHVPRDTRGRQSPHRQPAHGTLYARVGRDGVFFHQLARLALKVIAWHVTPLPV